jgi:hypothetical protein
MKDATELQQMLTDIGDNERLQALFMLTYATDPDDVRAAVEKLEALREPDRWLDRWLEPLEGIFAITMLFAISWVLHEARFQDIEGTLGMLALLGFVGWNISRWFLRRRGQS